MASAFWAAVDTASAERRCAGPTERGLFASGNGVLPTSGVNIVYDLTGSGSLRCIELTAAQPVDAFISDGPAPGDGTRCVPPTPARPAADRIVSDGRTLRRPG